MDTKKFLNIPEISAGTKFWMIRTKDGYFFNEYIREGFIAIGWNLIRESSFPLTKSQDESFKNIIKEKYKNVQPGSSINKCYKFCCEIKTGDIAVIVGRTDIAFAKIGDYYEDDNPEFTIEKELEINKKIEDGVHASEVLCPYIKRRKIEIINLIKYSNDINPYFFKALAANRHSLSRADKHADIILSTCYDAYIYHNTLSIAFRVDKKDSINAIAFSHFISYFSNYLIGINKDSISIPLVILYYKLVIGFGEMG